MHPKWILLFVLIFLILFEDVELKKKKKKEKKEKEEEEKDENDTSDDKTGLSGKTKSEKFPKTEEKQSEFVYRRLARFMQYDIIDDDIYDMLFGAIFEYVRLAAYDGEEEGDHKDGIDVMTGLLDIVDAALDTLVALGEESDDAEKSVAKIINVDAFKPQLDALKKGIGGDLGDVTNQVQDGLKDTGKQLQDGLSGDKLKQDNDLGKLSKDSSPDSGLDGGKMGGLGKQGGKKKKKKKKKGKKNKPKLGKRKRRKKKK